MGITLESIKEKMVGKTFGKLTVLNYVGKSERGDNLWKCKCSCGTTVVNRTSNVDKPTSACPSCKRSAGPKAEKQRTYLLGSIFGRLTVIEFAGLNKHLNTMWNCRCECGNRVTVKASSLMTRVTQSCGCYARERAAQANTKHGLHDHPLYAIWYAMKDRCYNPNNSSYPRYGDRGIIVCEDWFSDFLLFYQWSLNNGYREGLTLERSNNDGNYEPGNCIWTTRDVQMQNISLTKLSSDKVTSIRNDNRSNLSIALDYKVSESTINRVKSHDTWSNID